MHALTNRIDARRVTAALLAAMAIFAAVAAIPSGGSHDSLLASVGPQPAQAFEGVTTPITTGSRSAPATSQAAPWRSPAGAWSVQPDFSAARWRAVRGT